LPPELLLLAEICTKPFVGWGFAPNPTGRAYSAPSELLACLGDGVPRGKGRREWRGKERGEERVTEGRESRNAQIQSWQAYYNVCSHFFSNRSSSYSFSPILTKVGIHDQCAKKQWNIFRNFAFRIRFSDFI